MTKHLRASGRLALPLAVALTLLAACGTADKTKPAVVPSLIQSPEKKSITVSDRNDGATILLGSTQQLIVSLQLDVLKGREWSLVDMKPGVLLAPPPKFEREGLDANWNDAEGAMVWRFKPEAAGTVALRFELRRPRDLALPERTVNYTVTVK
jgi:predicted secreted protein